MKFFDQVNSLVLAGINTGIQKDIYQTGNNPITTGLKDIIKIVGGVGGLCFILAILIIALFIIFGSISPKSIGTWWKALLSCVAGALLFFSAFFLADFISQIFTGA